MDAIGDLIRSTSAYLSAIVLVYFLIVNGFYLLLMMSAAWQLRFHSFEVVGESRHRILSSQVAPRISMLVPAYNEEATVVESLRSLMTLAYPELEIVVIDDGSSDDTIGVLIEAFDLVAIHPIFQRRIDTAAISHVYRSRVNPNLIVARKENGGKADALNAALNLSTGTLVCSLDADTLVEEDALQRLVRPFLRSEDVVAAGATIRVANGCVVRNGRITEVRTPRTALAGIQAVEYLRAFLFGRVGWNRIGGNIVISGAFGLFRRDSLLNVGGYAQGVGEDMEVVVRLRRLGYETDVARTVVFVPDPVAWTEVPESLGVLGRQRDRWHRGLSDVLWRHRAVLLRRRYGALGLVLFPAFLLIEWFAPVIEAIGLIMLLVGLVVGAVDVQFAVLFFSVAYGLGMLMSVIAILLEELAFRRYGRPRDRFWLLLWAVVENLGYRQLTVFWRLRGIAGFLRGDTRWGAMVRTGFSSPNGSDAEPTAAGPRSSRIPQARSAPPSRGREGDVVDRVEELL
jgi:cellulose synthase/poly-beta-1,6-N-acetylglucosamine synthase-like glycosyltransferase